MSGEAADTDGHGRRRLLDDARARRRDVVEVAVHRAGWLCTVRHAVREGVWWLPWCEAPPDRAEEAAREAGARAIAEAGGSTRDAVVLAAAERRIVDGAGKGWIERCTGVGIEVAGAGRWRPPGHGASTGARWHRIESLPGGGSGRIAAPCRATLAELLSVVWP